MLSDHADVGSSNNLKHHNITENMRKRLWTSAFGTAVRILVRGLLQYVIR